ncbi:unnamed protein product, partial [Heterosigma akashiwo]
VGFLPLYHYHALGGIIKTMALTRESQHVEFHAVIMALADTGGELYPIVSSEAPAALLPVAG